MEMANQKIGRIRPAEEADAAKIIQLLEMAPYSHLHAGWHLPGDWLGLPTFVVHETREASPPSPFSLPSLADGVNACLAVAAEESPAAWVRLAALAQWEQGGVLWPRLFAYIEPLLVKQGVDQIGWLAAEPTPEEWLSTLGFQMIDQVDTWVSERLEAASALPANIEIRPALEEDFPTLAAIEATAFDPLWRHSANALQLAWKQSISFDVALVEGRPVAFQCSAAGQIGAHLVRLTVHPRVQGMGVGQSLLATAMAGYRRQGYSAASLNTQKSNLPSIKLYEKFHFRPTGAPAPVWRKRLV